jgi:hypothetical protein
MTYDWLIQVGVETVDPAKVGADWFDQWLHQVQRCLSEQVAGYKATGYRVDDTTRPFVELTATKDAATVGTCLLVVRLNNLVAVFLGGRDSDQDEAASEAWALAARCATESLGSPGQQFEWAALLGPPTPMIPGTEVLLAAPIQVGPFRLSPLSAQVHERWIPTMYPSMHSYGIAHWWPILVEGASDGYSWQAASAKAAFDLHRLSALASLGLGLCLVVRESPRPRNYGLPSPPDRLGGLDERSAAPTEPRIVLPFPAHLQHAWAELEKRPWLAAALGAYHEGLRTQLEHPSLALVAFIAAVEALSNRIFDESKCPTCHAHEHVAARFRSTLKLAVDDAEVLGAAYGPRSRTVHQGKLHGIETTPGSSSMALHDPGRDFQWGTVKGMERAAAKLLVLALTGQLPPKTPFVPE